MRHPSRVCYIGGSHSGIFVLQLQAIQVLTIKMTVKR
nr:MAG TPA: hypothetical protein [Caudoviricetes sp.]